MFDPRGALCLSLILTTSLAAQSDSGGRPGPRIMLPRGTEIALARSAAPASVSARATVLVLTDTGYAVGEEGTNGVTCLVDRSQPRSLEPHCFDPEAAATVLPIHIRQTELLREGRSMAEVDQEIAQGLLRGRFRLPRRPAMTYMMSAGQVLYDDDGKLVGRWRPHLMIFVPYLTSADLGLGASPFIEAAMVVDEGKPLANILVVVSDFVQPDSAASAR
jgi:hypothetical protein